MVAHYRDMDLSSTESCQWWNYRDIKVRPTSQIRVFVEHLLLSQSNARFPDLMHKTTNERAYNPSWVQEEFKRRGSHLRMKDMEVCLQEEMQMRKPRQIHHEVPQGQDMLIANRQEDIASLVASLKACAKHKDLFKGRRLHADIRKGGFLATNIYVGTAVVNMYAKCGALSEAQEVFDQLPVRDIVSWSTLIAGYAQHGYGHEALNCFECMKHEGVSPNAVTFACILKACGSVGATESGKEIHAEVVRQGLLEKDTVLGNALVDMYAKSGALAKAQDVFDELPFRNVVSWSALIAGYAHNDHGDKALNCFIQMHQHGFIPDTVTFACVLKACSSICATKQGEEIHAEIVRRRLLGKDIILGTALVDMYAKCGALAKAQKVFDELPVRDVVSWGALIAGYAQNGHGHEALNCFELMLREGLSPNAVTFACILKACGSIGAAEKGEEIHAEVVRQRLLEKNIILGNALVDMYVKCGALTKAQLVLDELPVRDVISWNTLIAGFVQQGHSKEGLSCFEQMQSEGLFPTTVTFACILKACGSIGAAEKGEQIHAEVVRQRLLEKDIILGNALVDMYAKCSVLAKAQEVFDELPVRDVVSWNALIAGYAQHGRGHEALSCFEQMLREGFSPDAITFACVLKACGIVGAAKKGEEIHAEVVKQRLLEKHVILGNALVDMYTKCGVLEKAQAMFNKLPNRNVTSWSALIAGYAQLGMVEDVIDLFNKMIGEGIGPDMITFTVLLNACTHAGLVDEGEMFFVTMSTKFGITPTLDHCTCMVDLFGRAGHFKKAMVVIDELPHLNSADYCSLWVALLGACQKWGNVQLGRLAFEHLVQTDGQDAAIYVCLSNINVAASMLREADKVEATRADGKHEDIWLLLDQGG